ncbi:MAG: tyrosine-type recombinase/integrase [Terracidiphilus sp.]
MPAPKPLGTLLNAPDYADRVNLIKKIKTVNGWRFAPVVPESNGRLKDRVRIDGQVEVHPEGTYFIEWRVGGRRGRRYRTAVARDEAIDAARRKAVELRAIRDGLIAAPEPEPAAPAKTPIGDAIDGYLRYVKMQRKPRTHLTYRYTLDVLLRASFKKKYVEDATRDDVLDFMTHCYEQRLGARTVYDKVVTVLQLFKRHGRSGLMEKGDWPNYVDTIRPIYEPEELGAMFKAATEDEATLLKFLLGSGFRDQEIRYVEWKDIDFRNHEVRVKTKPHWRFTPKNWEERVVPLPAGLIERLRKRKEARSATPNQLVFPNGRGKPDSEMDMIVKRVAERARLNCKQCVTEHNNKCAEGPYCMNFFLHKFRHTFATNHLRDGVDIRTVQAWLGHRDIKSTMVYLKGIRSKDAAKKVNSGELAALVA